MDDPLTSRETDTLRYVAEGAGNRDIANLMGVAEATVKTHLKNIFSKLRVNDRTQAVVLAAKRGIIDL
jgi:two-component system NarL family response regulator